MIIVEEKLYYTDCFPVNELYLFTANSNLTKSGKLVMGAGAAKEVRDAILGIDAALGALIVYDNTEYNLRIIASRIHIGAFQVKYNYYDKADLDLIRRSSNKLGSLLNTIKFNKVHMNFPGVGHGGLKFNDVYPMVANLPDNVFLYKV